MPNLQSKYLALVLITGLLVSACGSSPEPGLVDAEIIAQAVDGESDDIETDVYDSDEEGTNLEGLNVCEQIPLQEIAAITGPLREDETKQDLSFAGESGCEYHDQEGHWFYITYFPLSHWGLAELTLPEPESLVGVLDAAFLGRYSNSEVFLKALAANELVIGAHVSDGGEETAAKLVELAYKYKP